MALLVACSTQVTAPPGDRLVLEEAVLEVGEGTVVHARRATVDDDGAGEGEAVSATVQPVDSDPPPLEIEAPRSSWDLKARSVVFTGGVTGVRGDVSLTCDVLEVWLAADERVDRAVATGTVRIASPERVATGARAELDVDTGQVVLTGEPAVQEGPNHMTGTRIVLWLDDERLECEACRLVVDGPAVAPRP